MNILAVCADTPPITVSIQDCTKHLQQGGKKDASYIAEIFDDIVKEFDPNGTLTDAFFLMALLMSRRAVQFWWPSILTHSAFMGESM